MVVAMKGRHAVGVAASIGDRSVLLGVMSGVMSGAMSGVMSSVMSGVMSSVLLRCRRDRRILSVRRATGTDCSAPSSELRAPSWCLDHRRCKSRLGCRTAGAPCC